MLNLLTLQSRKITAKLKAERAIAAVGSQGLAKKILGKLARFGQWAIGKIIRTFNIDFDRIWDMLVDAYFELKEFDFNASDKELRQQIEANNRSIAVAASRALGEQIGIGTVRLVTAFAGRFIPGKKASSLRAAEGIKIPVLSKRIALALAEEQGSQLRSDTITFLESASRAMTSNALINAVLFTRNYGLFGAKPITQDIEASGSIAAKIDRKVEKLPKKYQAPALAFIDGFETGVMSAGYVVAGTLDDEIAAMRYALDERRQGATITVEAQTPEGEALTFVGSQAEVREAMDTALPLAPISGGKDAAVPQTWALKPGADRPQLVITYRAQTKNHSTHSLHIPNYDGRRSPNFPDYEAGQWMGLWVLSDGSKLQVYAASEREASIVMRALAKHVPRRFRTGRPRYINSDRRVSRKTMRWVSATYYPKGLSAASEWRAYRQR